MQVLTKACRMCGNNSLLDDVDALRFTLWQGGLMDILEAFPDFDADQRELLISGTHAHCWEKMWAGFSDD